MLSRWELNVSALTHSNLCPTSNCPLICGDDPRTSSKWFWIALCALGSCKFFPGGSSSFKNSSLLFLLMHSKYTICYLVKTNNLHKKRGHWEESSDIINIQSEKVFDFQKFILEITINRFLYSVANVICTCNGQCQQMHIKPFISKYEVYCTETQLHRNAEYMNFWF